MCLILEWIGMPISMRAPWKSALCHLSETLFCRFSIIMSHLQFTHHSRNDSFVTAFLAGYNESYTFKCSSHHHPVNKLWIVRHLCNGFATGVVSSLHLWTHIRGTTGIYFPQAQLSEVEETAFMCSGKGQRGLAGKEVPKNRRNRHKYSRRMLHKPQCCCWTAFNLHYWHPSTDSINLPLIMLHYLTESCLEWRYFLYAIWKLGSIAGRAQKSPGKLPTAKALSRCNACSSSGGSPNAFTDHTRMCPRGARHISVSIPAAANTMSSQPDHQICAQHIWALSTVLCDTIPWSWSWQTYHIKWLDRYSPEYPLHPPHQKLLPVS